MNRIAPYGLRGGGIPSTFGNQLGQSPYWGSLYNYNAYPPCYWDPYDDDSDDRMLQAFYAGQVTSMQLMEMMQAMQQPQQPQMMQMPPMYRRGRRRKGLWGSRGMLGGNQRGLAMGIYGGFGGSVGW
ncbi:hypothetical protein LTR37_014055 [Vermiconidia calcicola]|uniref:Uncharacterized protein n=1 Tax=Vermiconidia calcicola TaxID=1690605 RepID=A0ACC3MW62_9PEZI|nr:hypothetical protein LTR37_014055 [Vermiconidia calcicola]